MKGVGNRQCFHETDHTFRIRDPLFGLIVSLFVHRRAHLGYFGLTQLLFRALQHAQELKPSAHSEMVTEQGRGRALGLGLRGAAHIRIIRFEHESFRVFGYTLCVSEKASASVLYASEEGLVKHLLRSPFPLFRFFHVMVELT